jgi:hypothetical protein
MSDDYAFFEYRAKITNMGHAEDVGEPVHCFIKMKSGDEQGKRRRNVELEQQAGDIRIRAMQFDCSSSFVGQEFWLRPPDEMVWISYPGTIRKS